MLSHLLASFVLLKGFGFPLLALGTILAGVVVGLIIQDKYHGQPFDIPISNAMTLNSPGAANRINFDAQQADVNARNAVVKSILLRLPIPTITLAIGETLTEKSLLQLITSVTLQMSEESPVRRLVDGGHQTCTNIDPYRLRLAMGVLTGARIVRGLGATEVQVGNAIAGAGNALHYRTAIKSAVINDAMHEVPGGIWPHLVGPFGFNGSGAGGTVSWTDFVEFEFSYLPYGGEPVVDCPPLSLFTGFSACGKRGSGFIQFSLSANVDNANAVTWDNTKAMVFARCYLRPADKRSVPRIPIYRTYSVSGNNIETVRMATQLLAFCKALNTNGDMLAHSYTQAILRSRGEQLNRDWLIDHIGMLDDAILAAGRPGLRFFTPGGNETGLIGDVTNCDLVLSTANAVNRANPMVPLILETSDILRSIGTADDPMYIEVPQGGSGEATHFMLQAGWAQWTAEAVAELAKWEGWGAHDIVAVHKGNRTAPWVGGVTGSVVNVKTANTAAAAPNGTKAKC